MTLEILAVILGACVVLTIIGFIVACVVGSENEVAGCCVLCFWLPLAVVDAGVLVAMVIVALVRLCSG